jgi:hypothetical protein
MTKRGQAQPSFVACDLLRLNGDDPRPERDVFRLAHILRWRSSAV